MGPGYRTADIEAAAARHADLIEPKLDEEITLTFNGGHPHQVLAVIGIFSGLAQRFAPDRFKDDRAWTDIFSDPALYRVKDCEPQGQGALKHL